MAELKSVHKGFKIYHTSPKPLYPLENIISKKTQLQWDGMLLQKSCLNVQ